MFIVNVLLFFSKALNQSTISDSGHKKRVSVSQLGICKTEVNRQFKNLFYSDTYFFVTMSCENIKIKQQHWQKNNAMSVLDMCHRRLSDLMLCCRGGPRPKL